MPDNISPSNDHTTIVHSNRLGVLTIVSLSFNALILLLILMGIVCHHHARHHVRDHGEFAHRGEWGRGGDEGMRFHQHGFGGMHRDWNDEREGPLGRDQGPGEDRGPQDQAFHGGPDQPGGPNEGRMPGMDPFPTATGMTDHIMLHLDEQLALTDQENTQIRPVIAQQVAEIQKSMEAGHQAMQKSIEDTTGKIRPMLDADQQKKLDGLKTTMENKFAPKEATPAKEK